MNGVSVMLFGNETGFRRLVCERLPLREPHVSDATDLFAFCSDPESCRYADWQPHTDKSDSRAYISWLKKQMRTERGRVCTWFAALKDSQKVIGTVSIVDTDYSGHIVTVGYTFSGEYQHHGYATEAVTALLDYLFRQRDIARVQAKVMPQNLPSIRLLERVGMRQEGLLKQGAFCKTTCVDVFLYAVTREEWLSRVGKAGRLHRTAESPLHGTDR